MAGENNIAEFLLRVTTQGTGDARNFAIELGNVDSTAKKLAVTVGDVGPRISGMEPHTERATRGFGHMAHSVATLDMVMARGLNPEAAIGLARGFLFLESAATGSMAALSGPVILGVSAVLAIVGKVMHDQSARAEEAKKETESYAKALEHAREANQRFNDTLAHGRLPSNTQVRSDVESDTKALVEAEKKLALLEKERKDSSDQYPRAGYAAEKQKLQQEIGELNTALEKARHTGTSDIEEAANALLALEVQQLRNENAATTRSLEEQKALRAKFVADGLMTEQAAHEANAADELTVAQKTLANLTQLRDLYYQQSDVADRYGSARRASELFNEARKVQEERLKLKSEANIAEQKNDTETLKLTEKQEKEAAAAAIALAKAQGSEQLSVAQEWQQKLADYQREHGGAAPSGDMVNLGKLAVATAAYADSYKKADAALGGYEEKVRHVNELLQAGQIDQAEANQRIREAATVALPQIMAAIPALEKWAAAERALGKDTSEADRQIEKLRKSIDELNRAGQHDFAATMRQRIGALKRDWGDLNKQIADLTVHTIQSFGNAGVHAFMGWIEGSKSAGQAMREFGLSVIETIMQVVVQFILAHTILAALSAIFKTTEAATGAATGAALAAAYAPAALLVSIATMGAADGIGLAAFTAATMAGTAIGVAAGAVPKAEGGLITGGTPGQDSVHALLMPGEYVLPAHIVNRLGVDRLEAIRTGMANRSFSVPAFSAPSQPYAEAGQHRGGSGNLTVHASSPDTHVLIGDREIEKVFASATATKFFKSKVAVHGAAINAALTRHKGYKQ